MTKKSKRLRKKKQQLKEVVSDRLFELKRTDVLDGYKDFLEIGRGNGGFSVIYSTQTSSKKARVALKLYTYQSSDQQSYQLRYEKFKNEVLILKLLETHPHILTCHNDAAKTEGKHNGKDVRADYFTMELLGGSLSAHMEDLQDAQTPWTLGSKLAVLIQVCKALEHAHALGIYHRDLYTDNILLVDSQEPLFAKLTDFGAAKASSIKPTTKYYFPLGAKTISSPEMIVGLADDKDKLIRSDIFSLGLLIYQIIMESPHSLENLLLRINVPPEDTPREEREKYLIQSVMPFLQTFTSQPIILLDNMTNSTDIEQGLNNLVKHTAALDSTQRPSGVKSVREELEKCRNLINA